MPIGDASVEVSLQQLHHQQQTAATNSLASAVSAVRNKGKRKSNSHLSANMHSLPPHTLHNQLDKMLTDRMLNLAESQKKYVAEQTANIFYNGKLAPNKTSISQALPADLSLDYSAAAAKTNGGADHQHNNNNNHRNNNNSSPGGLPMGINCSGHIKSERLSPVEMTPLTTGAAKNGDLNRKSR